MQSDVLTRLTAEAVAAYNLIKTLRPEQNPFFGLTANADAVLNEAQLLMQQLQLAEPPGLRELSTYIFSDPEFQSIAPIPDTIDPMIMYPGGGIRGPADNLLRGIFHSSFLQIYYLRQQDSETTFVRNVIEGFEELRRAIRGERVRCYLITGFSRLTIPDNVTVTTPWGQIKSIASTHPAPWLSPWHPQTTCLLAEQKLWPVVFDRSAEPQALFDPADLATPKSHQLLPLACALSSGDPHNPVVPLVTWTTSLLPFVGTFSYSTQLLSPSFNPNVDMSGQISELEEWTRVIDRTHAPGIDVAVRRIVSAVAHRLDKSDSLIDAVMALENLLGTENEVVFRVSAALAKLVEKTPQQRKPLRKRISEIYGIRSRLVHGALVDPNNLNQACTEAIGLAIRALRESYKLGADWLAMSSSDRSNSIILEWP